MPRNQFTANNTAAKNHGARLASGVLPPPCLQNPAAGPPHIGVAMGRAL
jgi:hypothetical protein